MSGATQTPGNPFRTVAVHGGWSFSLLGLMQFVLASAVAVAMGKNVITSVVETYRSIRDPDLSFGGMMFKSEWSELSANIAGIAGSFLAPIAALMTLSLVMQAARIFLQSRNGDFASLAERFSWGFQILGRIGLALILVGCVLVDDLITAEKLGLTVKDDIIWPSAAAALRRAVLIVAMMACLGWNRRDEDSQIAGLTGRWLYRIIMLSSAAYFAMILWSNSSIHVRLVHMALLGMEMYAPLKFADPSISVLPMERIAHFTHLASLTSIASLVSISSCHVLISWRTVNRVWQTLLAIMLVAGWSAQAAFLHWVYWNGFYSLSPAWPWETAFQHGHVAATATLLTVLVAGVAAYRGCAQPREGPLAVLFAPRKWSFHESSLAIGLAAVVAAGHVSLYVLFQAINSEVCLWLAILIFCLAQLWRAWRRPRGAIVNLPWFLPPGRFLASWLAVAVTLGLAAPTLGLFSFAFWLRPVNWIPF